MPLTADHLTTLYERHARDLVAYFARRTYDAEAAVDLTAEVFAIAFSRRSRFRGEPLTDGVRWLYGIARHELADWFRSGEIERRAVSQLGVERRALTEPEFERIEELAGLAELRGRVEAELSALPAQTAEILRLRIVEELDYPELAERLTLAEPAVRARVSRALRALEERLTPYRPSEEATHA